MKNIEKLAIVFIILLVLSSVPNSLLNLIIIRVYGPNVAGQFSMMVKMMAALHGMLGLMVHIGVGIWLFVLARRENATPWIWLLFGLFTGLIAVVLFFLMKVYESVRPANIVEKAQSKG